MPIRSLIILIAAASAFLLCFLFLPHPQPTPAWTAVSGKPTPADFLYAMFPRSSGVRVHDAPTGAVVGLLERPLLNSHEEITSEAWIAVRDPSSTSWVALADLTYTPAADAPANFLGALSAAYRARAHSAEWSVSLALSPSTGAPPTTFATLRLTQDDHWQEYSYEIAGGTARPISMTRAFGPTEALKDLGRISYALLAAIAAIPLAAFFTRGKRTRPAPG